MRVTPLLQGEEKMLSDLTHQLTKAKNYTNSTAHNCTA